MELAEFLSAASEALSLLLAFPWQWLLIVIIFLVAVESLMFIPYVGFIAKLAVASVVVAQVIAIFGSAAAGQSPSPARLLSAFTLPVGSQLALVVSALLPFAIGVTYLYMRGGPAATEFFFSNILKVKPPEAALFTQFKYVMQAVALPFTFLAGAVVLKGLSGVTAISAALSAAVANWLPVLLLGLLAIAFEWLSAQLPSLMPKGAAALLGGLMLVAYLAVTFALTYTVSARVFGQASARSAA